MPLGTLAAIEDRSRPAQAIVRFQGEPARALFVWRSQRRLSAGRGPGLAAASGGAAGRPARHGGLERCRSAPRAPPPSRPGGPPHRGPRRRRGSLARRPAGRPGPRPGWPRRRGRRRQRLPAGWRTAQRHHPDRPRRGRRRRPPLAALRLVAPARAPGPGARPPLPQRRAVPVAVALAGAELGPLLAEPALALLLAAAAGVLAVMLLPVPPLPTVEGGRKADRRGGPSSAPPSAIPPPPSSSPPPPPIRPRPVRRRPRPPTGEPAAGPGEPYSRPSGSPRGLPWRRRSAASEKLEKALAKAAEVERFWSLRGARPARAVAELGSASRDAGSRLRLLALRLRYEAGRSGSAWRSPPGRALRAGQRRRIPRRPGGPCRIRTRRPRTYRVILRGANLDGRAGRPTTACCSAWAPSRSGRYWITGLGDPTIQLVLRPRLGTNPGRGRGGRRPAAPGQRAAAVHPSALGARGSATVPDRGAGRHARGPGPGRPPDDAICSAARCAMDGRVIVPAALLARLRRRRVSPRIPRQSGRLRGAGRDPPPAVRRGGAQGVAAGVDRSLGQLPLPAACDLERPPLDGSVPAADACG